MGKQTKRTGLTMSSLLQWTLLGTLCISVVGDTGASVTVDKDSDVDIDKNAMGMSVLYDMVHYFLGNILHTEKITDSFLNLSTIVVDGNFDTNQLNDWKSWLSYMTGFAVCLGVGVLYLVLMPIVGALFCCCRCCCGKCGGQKKPMDDKRAACKRRTYCFFVIIFNTLVLAGVVCGFVCNTLIHKNLQNDDGKGAIGSVKTGLLNFGNFMNTSFDDASNYILDQYGDTKTLILNDVDATADQAVDKVLIQLNATELINQARGVAVEANKTRDQLIDFNKKVTVLKDESKTLQNNLTAIRNSIDSVCTPQSKCPEYKPTDYNTETDFSSLQSLQNQTDNIEKALDISKHIDEAEAEINKTKAEAQKQVKTQVDEATQAVNTITQTVNDEIKKFRDLKDGAIEFIPALSDTLDSSNEDVRKYSNYAFYGGLGVCSVYLLVVLLYYFGVLFGLCGERPGEGAPCCHTGRGANLLMGGVALTFIFSWLLMLLCVILFLVGGPMYTEVCRYVVDHNPQDLRFLDDVLINGLDIQKNFFDNSEIPKGFTVSNALQECQNNKSLYTSLRIDDIVNLTSIFNLESLEGELNKLKTSNINIPSVNIMSDDLKNGLEEFTNAGLDTINFAEYFQELEKKLTPTTLETMAAALNDLANNTALQLTADERTTLRENAESLQKLNTESIPRIKKNANHLNASLTEIQKSSTLKTSVQRLITDLTSSSENFNANSSTLIKKEIENLAERIMDMSQKKVDGIIHEIRENKPKCSELVSAFYSLTDSACILGLDPVNGLWFSFGWCLIFFIPTLIFAVLLAGQYRCELEYEKDFDEPNYQMYGGSNNDTIPLTSVSDSVTARGMVNKE